MIDDAFLKILRCPATRQPLRPATTEEKSRINLSADADALATLDGANIYGVSEGLLVLLPSVKAVVSAG